MKKVNVLMSSYNGEKYIYEQIESILQQNNVKVDLLVRDDGSKDNTIKILNELQNKRILRWYEGKNLGPAHSFLTLLRDSNEADYYAFADQDDYWEKDKLSTAITFLETAGEQPALYFSRTQMTDAVLTPTNIVEINPLMSFGESLVYEFIPGCTMVLNHALRNIINLYIPQYLPMHDVWIYCVAKAINAKIYFDKTPHILYRQHSANTIGQGNSTLHEWKRRWKRFAKSEHSRYRRAQELEKGYGKMLGKNESEILHIFLSAKHSFYKRLKVCIDKRFDCANHTTRLLFNIALILNSY